jgi:putative FmdB family regulatory protein
MPTYDYACSACKHRFERFEPIGDGGLKKCPQCGKKKAKRMLGTGAGLIFKGSGFYTTDYKRSSGGGDKDSGGAKDSEKKPAAKEAKEKKKEEKEHKK